jgi:2,3-diketo-5-methylthiopentyl-1-phosphate enolase
MRRLPYESLAGRLEQAALLLSVEDTGQVDIAFPLNLCCDDEGLTHLLLLLTTAADYDYADEFWIESIDIPRALANRFPGPRFGIAGIRDLFQVYSRPIVGLTIRPRTGLPLSKVCDICESVLRAGVDFIADDLLLVDPPGEMRFQSRIPALTALVKRVTLQTGEPKHYLANIAVAPRRAGQMLRMAVDAGAGGVMVNAFTMGFGTVKELIDDNSGMVPFIATNLGVGIMTRQRVIGPRGRATGLSEAIVSKLSRLAGADAVHAGTLGAGMLHNVTSGWQLEAAWRPGIRALTANLHHLKPCFAVAEGALTIATLWDNITNTGPDIMIRPTSGILTFPGGPANGAKAFRLMVSELHSDMTEDEARRKILHLANRYHWLRDGLRNFGYDDPTQGKR